MGGTGELSTLTTYYFDIIEKLSQLSSEFDSSTPAGKLFDEEIGLYLKLIREESYRLLKLAHEGNL